MKPWMLIIVGLLILASGGVAMASDANLHDRINRFADAIAFAEGFYVSGSRPERDNNPGDLTRDLGYPTSGMDGMYVIFATIDDGWNALKRLIELMLTNRSTIYNNQMTIWDVARYYTTTQQSEWAINVASRLGVPVFTKISEI